MGPQQVSGGFYQHQAATSTYPTQALEEWGKALAVYRPIREQRRLLRVYVTVATPARSLMQVTRLPLEVLILVIKCRDGNFQALGMPMSF